MKKQFVSFDLAIKLRTLGYTNPCMGMFYIKNKEFHKTDYSRSNLVKTNSILVDAPLWQEVIDWLRITHNIIIEIWFDKTQTDGFPWLYEVYVHKIPIHITGDYFDTYEEAREYAISYILNNLKCSHNGLKREGESCSLNNNCIYPKCLTFKDPLNDS